MRCVKSKENPWFRHFFMKDFRHSAKKPTILMGVAPLLSALGTAFKPKEGPKRKKNEKKTKRCAADAKHKTEKRTKGRAKPSKAKPNMGQDTPGEALCTVKVNPITGKKVVTGKREKVSWLLWKLLHWQIVIFVGFFLPDEIKLHSSNAQVKASQVYPPKFALRIVAGHFPDCVSQHWWHLDRGICEGRRKMLALISIMVLLAFCKACSCASRSQRRPSYLFCAVWPSPQVLVKLLHSSSLLFLFQATMLATYKSTDMVLTFLSMPRINIETVPCMARPWALWPSMLQRRQRWQLISSASRCQHHSCFIG